MHKELELNFANVLILLIGLGVSYWMARAPNSVLMLMSNRYRGIGLDSNRPWLTALVRNFGRFTFFMLVNGMLLMLTPSSFSQSHWFSLVVLVLAVGISVLTLRKPGRRDLYGTLSRPPSNGGRPSA